MPTSFFHRGLALPCQFCKLWSMTENIFLAEKKIEIICLCLCFPVHILSSFCQLFAGE
jgi:hypothetical protein